MKTALQFPVYDEREFPPPHFPFSVLISRMAERWFQLSDQQKEERLKRDQARRIPVRFTLTDDDQDAKPS